MSIGLNKYIERNPAKSFTMPSLIGRRLTVYDIVIQIFLEENIEKAIKYYEISIEEALAALAYCSTLTCKTDCIGCNFCDGCQLRAIQEGSFIDKSNYEEIRNEDGTWVTISKIDNSIYLGSLENLIGESNGRLTWEIAEILLNKYLEGNSNRVTN